MVKLINCNFTADPCIDFLPAAKYKSKFSLPSCHKQAKQTPKLVYYEH